MLSIASAALLSLAWPARGFPFLLWVALAPLLYIEDELRAEHRKGWKFFGYSYLTFVLWNFATTWWIYLSSPEGAYMAILVNAIFMAVVMRLFQYTKSVLGATRGYIALILYWLAFEYVHSDWDLSWPWLMLGNGFANYVEVVQWYEWTGVLGGTLWIWWLNIRVVKLAQSVLHKEFSPRQLIAPLLIAFIPVSWSLIRYFTYTEKEDPIHVVLVQPNIDPWKKFDAIPAADQVNHMLSLALTQVNDSTDYVICPETAIPLAIWEDEIPKHPFILQIQEFVHAYPNVRFITGITSLSVYQEGDNIPVSADELPDGAIVDDHNAALQIDTTAQYPIYYKSRLVPGPEKLPFAAILKPMQKQLFGNLGGQIGNLGTQPEREAFDSPFDDAKAGPVICYESIYGGFMTGYVRKGANFISVSTNDAWWGDTPGYKQLLAYTRLRALELRRSVARSANTGISCFINQRGDVIQPTQYLETTAISGTINLNETRTLYSRLGDYLGGISLLIGGMLLLFTFVRGFLKKREQKS